FRRLRAGFRRLRRDGREDRRLPRRLRRSATFGQACHHPPQGRSRRDHAGDDAERDPPEGNGGFGLEGWLMSPERVIEFIVRGAIIIAAFSPIWRRLYIEHFWVRVRAAVIRVDREFSEGSEASGWVWVPTIEYYADGQRWAFPKSYLQRSAGFFG